jgi:catabolite regulation protein CreA
MHIKTMTSIKAVLSWLCLSAALAGTQAFAPHPKSINLSGYHGISTRISMAKGVPESSNLSAITSRRTALTSFLATSAAVLTGSRPSKASAAESRTIARLQGSGLVFKDTLVVESFDDPKVSTILLLDPLIGLVLIYVHSHFFLGYSKVKGVTLYVSNFERPMTERIQKDFFTEPSYASVTCVKTGPIELADNIDKSDKGEVSENVIHTVHLCILLAFAFVLL